MDRYLKTYLKNNFDFSVLKKCGFYSKEIKSTDYEKQAERICRRHGLKNIYDYSVCKAVEFYYPMGQGFVTGEFRNQFGEDILKVLFSD